MLFNEYFLCTVQNFSASYSLIHTVLYKNIAFSVLGLIMFLSLDFRLKNMLVNFLRLKIYHDTKRRRKVRHCATKVTVRR